MIEMKKQITPGETPEKITVSMIDQDLKDGISKPEMAIKYGIKPWEVDEMFKHPFLKGRRPSRKKTLSFSFVDDITTNKTRYVSVDLPLNSGDIAVEQAEEVDPNQMTLEQAIDEATESVEAVKDQMQQTQEAIIDMLSPTEYETEENFVEELETLANESDDTTIEEKEEEEELEMDDDTFEL